MSSFFWIPFLFFDIPIMPITKNRLYPNDTNIIGFAIMRIISIIPI